MKLLFRTRVILHSNVVVAEMTDWMEQPLLFHVHYFKDSCQA